MHLSANAKTCHIFFLNYGTHDHTDTAKDYNSEHYLLAPVRLDIDIDMMDLALSTVGTDTATERSYYPVLEATSGHLRLVHVKKGPPGVGRPMFGKSLPQGTVNYVTGLLYLFDDDLGCVYTAENWGRMDFWERSDNEQMDIVLPVHCTPYERFFKCPERFKDKKPKNLDPNRCNCASSSLDQQSSFFTLPFVIVLISVAVFVFFAASLTLLLSGRRRRSSNSKRKLTNTTCESVMQRSLSLKKIPRRVVKPKAVAKSTVVSPSSSKSSLRASKSISKRSPLSSSRNVKSGT